MAEKQKEAKLAVCIVIKRYYMSASVD